MKTNSWHYMGFMYAILSSSVIFEVVYWSGVLRVVAFRNTQLDQSIVPYHKGLGKACQILVFSVVIIYCRRSKKWKVVYNYKSRESCHFNCWRFCHVGIRILNTPIVTITYKIKRCDNQTSTWSAVCKGFCFSCNV